MTKFYMKSLDSANLGGAGFQYIIGADLDLSLVRRSGIDNDGNRYIWKRVDIGS